MLGRWAVGLYAVGTLPAGEDLIVNYLLFENEFSAYSSVDEFVAALGLQPLGKCALATATLNAVDAQQIQALNVPNLAIEHTFQGAVVQQIQACTPEDLEIEHEFQEAVIQQIQACTPEDLAIEHEFYNVDIFIETIELGYEFSTYSPKDEFASLLGRRPMGLYALATAELVGFRSIQPTQIQVISAVDDFVIEHAFDEATPIQAHNINTISDWSVVDYFEVPTNIQVNIIQGDNMSFVSSFYKIFPTITEGGYLFITVKDSAGTIHNMSFEGIESE